MAFRLDDIIIDRLQYAVATDFSDNLLYVLTQLSDAQLNVSADSTDAVDNLGTLIKRFWRGKTGEFTATNALVNFNIIAAMSGSDKEYASATNAIVMPKIATVKSGSTLNLGANYVVGSVHVAILYGNGAMGQTFTLGTTASNTEFAIDSSGVLTPPTGLSADDFDPTKDVFIVHFKRTITANGMKLANSANKFPQTIHFTIKALAVDPCNPDSLRSCYIYLPSFQPSPEVSVQLTTDATIDYTGALQVDYCSNDKVLYELYWADEDTEQ